MGINSLLDSNAFLSRCEFSTLTDLSFRTISKLIASGEVSSIRVGRRRLIPTSPLLRFVERYHSTHSLPPKAVGR